MRHGNMHTFMVSLSHAITKECRTWLHYNMHLDHIAWCRCGDNSKCNTDSYNVLTLRHFTILSAHFHYLTSIQYANVVHQISESASYHPHNFCCRFLGCQALHCHASRRGTMIPQCHIEPWYLILVRGCILVWKEYSGTVLHIYSSHEFLPTF